MPGRRVSALPVGPLKRGDMIIEFRVMSSVEAWLKVGNRMRWIKNIGYTLGGLGVLWLGLRALIWGLDLEDDYFWVPDG